MNMFGKPKPPAAAQPPQRIEPRPAVLRAPKPMEDVAVDLGRYVKNLEDTVRVQSDDLDKFERALYDVTAERDRLRRDLDVQYDRMRGEVEHHQNRAATAELNVKKIETMLNIGMGLFKDALDEIRATGSEMSGDRGEQQQDQGQQDQQPEPVAQTAEALATALDMHAPYVDDGKETPRFLHRGAREPSVG